MLKKLIIVAVTYALKHQVCFAQYATPPSLAVGLSGLVGERGNIDVELLTEIISQKQEELKKEGIRRIMNKEVLNHSYALWDFTNHSLEMLLYSKDKKAIEKELAEYATNMVLVYGFAEAYLQASYQLGNKQLLGVIRSYPFSQYMDSANWKMYLDTLSKSQGEVDSVKTPILKPSKLFWLSKLKHSAERDLKIEFFDTTKQIKNGKLHLLCHNKTNYDLVNFNSYFLDLVYDVLNENKKLHDLGFFAEVRHSGEEEHNQKNKYRLMNEKHSKFKLASQNLRQRINEELNVFIDNYYIMKVTYNNGLSIDSIFSTLSNPFTTKSLDGMFYNDSSYTVLTGNYNAINSVFVDTLLEKEVENLLRISDTIAKKLSANKLAGDISISDSLAIELNNCSNFLRHIRAVARYDLTNDDLLYVREKALPLFLQLNLIYGTGQQYIDDMRKLVNFVYAKNVYRVKKELAMLNLSKGLSGVPLNKLYDFVKLLTELNKLDKANTYDYVFNTIKQVSTVLPDGKAKKYLSVLTDNVERFAFINKEENKIEIDVEEILLQLYKRYAEQNNSYIKFYLSLGLNQTLNIHYNKGRELLNDASDTDSKLKSLAFASEKIGIKWEVVQFPRKKIRDNESKLSYSNTNPFFKDVHLIAFGSGILYNIVNTTTSKNFKAMLTGIGAGTSFYNGLDVNLFMAFPLLSNESFGKSVSRRHMFGFSMDIKFMEYIDALRKKRAEQKNKS